MKTEISLRDYFAIEILKTLIPINDGLIVKACGHQEDSKRIILDGAARDAYAISDAMMAEREKNR